MIEVITGTLSALAGMALGALVYHYAFKVGARTVWRVQNQEPELFGPEPAVLAQDTTEDADIEAASEEVETRE